MIRAFSRVSSPRNRAWLLASAATLSLAITGAAHAQAGPPEGSIIAPQGGNPDPNIVISNPVPPTTVNVGLDTHNITGVGQLVVDQKNGFIGLCTATLINPRTVIFAAHCVNEAPAGNAFQDPWGYGTGAGQLPIGVFFNANNNAPGNSAIGHWLNGVNGVGKDATRVAEFAYNLNQVMYNIQSTQLGVGNNFLQGDVAMGVLDTPAANVPTWALLFSALPAPTSTNPVTGTGYHVTITGYGDNGVGSTGQGSIDYRRRVAENYIGLLGSLDDQDKFLFGAPDGLPQNLYMLDFDDPKRQNPYDFNIFPDDAVKGTSTTAGEGITAPGDSGGPLILDRTYAKQLVIAVLSGGDRFYGGQPGSSYGTTSFYQPLYLFWDYIAANNPYHYVSALAGDGNWTDPTHWTTNVDPAYNVLVNGQLMTGVPTTPGTGIADTSPVFGSVCYYDVCENIVTGVVTVNGVPVNATTPAAATGTQTADATKTATGVGSGLSSNLSAQSGSQSANAVAALPAPTLANGLPGATNFVPNDANPNAATHTAARYFDVTLSAAGTTTLDTAITVDRFSVSGASSKLSVTSTGSLTSLINMNQYDGVVVNNGMMTSLGDYLLLSGAVQGVGRFNAPYFTNVTGIIAPGTIGGTGTLTFAGNLVLASGSKLLLDLGANGVSDKIAVVTTIFAPNQIPVDGIAGLGGTVAFGPATGYMIRAGDKYTIVTAQGGFTKDSNGKIIPFDSVLPISAILTPHLTYGTNAVTVSIDAGFYKDVVGNTDVQKAYASLLDGDRANNYGVLSGLYGPLDLQSAATIQGTLESWAPRTETNRDALGTVSIDNMSRFYRDHVEAIEVGNLGGSIAMIGHPFEMASNRAMNMPDTPEIRSDAGETVMEGKLPETMSAFVAGGYLNGTSATMPTALPATGRDHFDGYFLAAGVEKEAGSHGVVGISFAYSDIGATPAYVSHEAKSQLYEGTLYGKIQTDGGFVADAMLSAGSFNSQTVRNVSLVGAPYRLTTSDRSLIVAGEISFGQDFNLGSLKLGPRIGVRASSIMFDDINEQGGGPALTYYRDSYDSLQARAGLHLSGGKTVKPYLAAYEVHELDDEPGLIAANFTGAIGPTALFAVAGQDKDWAEVSGGLSYSTGKVEISVGADTTIWRTDVANQSYHGTVKLSF
ncbi:hypothetical protein GCM10009087_25160 [Sphingomonas oligophenolica]|uniref:Autotransporter outer membrane beta-barrel domain-containing protein n=1 Tax=Sphingomonas oligophenolica TaxID=301154 RepID=A0ABU9Y9K7_9SPHN